MSTLGIIFAIVTVLVAGLALAIGYCWGSKDATNYVIENVETIVAEELLEEMLEDPNSSEATKTALQNLMKPVHPLTGGFKVEDKQIVRV